MFQPTLFTRGGEPLLVEAAVDAVTDLLCNGSPSEHQKLMQSEVFPLALDLHQTGSQRRLSLKLLHGIIRHLSHGIISDEELTKRLLYLFESVRGNSLFN